MTLPLLQQMKDAIICNHEKALGELDHKYSHRIMELLNQKTLIVSEIQKSFLKHLTEINNIINKQKINENHHRHVSGQYQTQSIHFINITNQSNTTSQNIQHTQTHKKRNRKRKFTELISSINKNNKVETTNINYFSNESNPKFRKEQCVDVHINHESTAKTSSRNIKKKIAKKTGSCNVYCHCQKVFEGKKIKCDNKVCEI
eukprot:UN06504